MNILKTLLLFSFSFVVFTLMPSDTSEASSSSFKYCLEFDIESTYSGATYKNCTSYTESLGYFLTRIPSKIPSSNPPNFTYWTNDYGVELIYFTNKGFEYYIPSYVISTIIQSDGYDYGFITYSDYVSEYDESKNTIPDFIDEKIVDVFDDLYTKYFDDCSSCIDFPNSKEFDDGFQILLDFYDFNTYGLFDIEGNYIMINMAPGGTLIKNGFDYDDDDIEATIAHELFHAIQYQYVGDIMNRNDNFYEGTAVMMQSKMSNYGTQYLSYLDSLVISDNQYPEVSGFGPVYQEGMSDYGSFLWYTFLYEHYGKDMIVDLLSEFSKNIIKYDDGYASFQSSKAMVENEGDTIEDAYLEYILWNYDKSSYKKGSSFPDVYILNHHDKFPTSEVSVPASYAPYFFGSNYIDFELDDDQDFVVNFKGDSSADYYLSFIPMKETYTTIKSLDRDDVSVVFVEGGDAVEYVVPNDKTYERIVMIVSVIGIDQDKNDSSVFVDRTYPYSYSANTTVYSFGDEADDSVESGSEIGDGDNKFVVEQVKEVVFNDLAENHKNKDAILYLNSIEMIGGYPDGSFKPDNPINRGELMKILVEGKGVTPLATEYSDCYTDVGSEWFAPYVCYAEQMKWVDGYLDGSFKPGDTVTKVEAIKMLLNSQGVVIPENLTENPFDDVDVGTWFGPYIAKAKELGILEETGSTFVGGNGMTRAGVCENLFRLLTY